MEIEVKKTIVSEECTIKKAMQIIDQNGLGVILVCDKDNNFCGLATEGDLRREMLAGKGWETQIKSVMKKDPVVVSEGTSREDILRLMNTKIRHIPVLSLQNKVVDLVSYAHFFYIPVAEPEMSGKELEYVTDCIATNWVSSVGKYVELFEQKFSNFCETKFGVATSSGTTALHLALEVLGIGKEDEVIVPSLSFIATANAVAYTGAKPVFVDVSADTWTMDPNEVKKAITLKTKAIIPVHLYGHPADMDSICAIAKKYNLFVIEDAAEAHGAEYKGKKVGSLSDMACFSFFGNKIITTGEGGMITTDNLDFKEKAKMLRSHGMSKKKKYWHPCVGFNYRLTNIQAALGVAQLEKIDDVIKRKRHNAHLYNGFLKDVKGVTLPPEKEWAKNVFWMYSILIENDYGTTRDALMKKLIDCGIDTRPVFYPIHSMPPYGEKKKLPETEKISSKGLSLPSAAMLAEQKIKRICEFIKEIKES